MQRVQRGKKRQNEFVVTLEKRSSALLRLDEYEVNLKVCSDL